MNEKVTNGIIIALIAEALSQAAVQQVFLEVVSQSGSD